jgi:hypothetical protein
MGELGKEGCWAPSIDCITLSWLKVPSFDHRRERRAASRAFVLGHGIWKFRRAITKANVKPYPRAQDRAYAARTSSAEGSLREAS